MPTAMMTKKWWPDKNYLATLIVLFENERKKTSLNALTV